jgi:hypothetical protein
LQQILQPGFQAAVTRVQVLLGTGLLIAIVVVIVTRVSLL